MMKIPSSILRVVAITLTVDVRAYSEGNSELRYVFKSRKEAS